MSVISLNCSAAGMKAPGGIRVPSRARIRTSSSNLSAPSPEVGWITPEGEKIT
jgi:hypothetical protein